MRLVVDTCILGASGDPSAEDQMASACGEFLLEVRENNHKAVLSKELEDEWSRVRVSPFSSTWWYSMESKNMIDRIGDVVDTSLRSCIDTLNNNKIDPSMRKAMLEDIHLVEAALNTDFTVSSVNSADQAKFCKAAQYVKEIRQIVWADPNKNKNEVIQWLKAGANPVDKWMLGYKP